MLRKLTIILALALACLGVNAQLPVGGWTIHSPFSGVNSVAETKGMVYFLSGSSLFSYDKSTSEFRTLNMSNVLNGASVTKIISHPQGKYLMVVYNDCNIDRINDDGSVINIPDIKEALIAGKPEVNHIGFGKGKIYVACSFGLVTLDEKKNETKETMFTPYPVRNAFGMGDNVVITYNDRTDSSVGNTNYHLWFAPQDKRLVSIDQFTKVNVSAQTMGDKALPVGDKRLVLIYNNNGCVAIDFDFEAATAKNATLGGGGSGYTGMLSLFPVGNDKVGVNNYYTMFVYSPECGISTPESYPLCPALQNNQISALDGLGKLWGGNSAGLAQFDATNPDAATMLGSRFGSTNFATRGCNNITLLGDGTLMFWNATDRTGYYTLGLRGRNALTLTSFRNGEGFSTVWPNSQPGSVVSAIGEPTAVVQDPLDPSTIYIAGAYSGFFSITNGVATRQYTSTNTQLVHSSSGFYAIAFMGFDNFNNLWVVQEDAANSKYTVHAVSYDNLHKETLSADDWTTFQVVRTYRSSRGTMLNKSNMLAACRSEYDMGLHLIKLKGTASFADDEWLKVTSYVDQDGKSISFDHMTRLFEDSRGHLWIGTNKGVFEIVDPTSVTTDVANVNRFKVPRNDGTGLADYLLETEVISCICEDPSGRKWISTTTSGVYLVSADGDEIIEHYTTSNSVLPSNTVYSVACDPNSSSVFFATVDGVVEYNSTSAPASDNLDNVYAFPNPVRPDYSGWITVTGLMDNTLVKIADSAGNVFFQGRSEGGMITWDGCNAAGDRVKTGVYYVFASAGASGDSASDSCVTKIMVIN